MHLAFWCLESRLGRGKTSITTKQEITSAPYFKSRAFGAGAVSGKLCSYLLFPPAATLHPHWDSTTICKSRGQNAVKAVPPLKINPKPVSWPSGGGLCMAPRSCTNSFISTQQGQHGGGSKRRDNKPWKARWNIGARDMQNPLPAHQGHLCSNADPLFSRPFS